MKKRLLIYCILLFMGMAAQAQDFEIVSVEHLPNDFAARKEMKNDPEGRQCALLRIATQNITPEQRERFSFKPDQGAYIVERATRDGEIWLWVSPKLKHLRLKHRDWGQVELHMDNSVSDVEALHVYKIVLRGTLVSPPPPLLEQQYLVFQITPVNAMLEVDGQLWSVDADGIAMKYVDFGTYNYRVMASDYFTETGKVTVDDPENTMIVPVTLKPNFAEITLTVDADAEIWVNNKKKGTRTWTGLLGNGIYKIECKQANHETSMVSKEITPAMNGQTITLPAPTPIYSSLNIESTPNLATIYIDDKEVGKTPKSIPQITVGSHEIKLSKDGYADYKEIVTIRNNENNILKIVMNDDIDVSFICNAPISILKIDSQVVGSATGTYTLRKGKHSIKVMANGYQEYATIIDVDAKNKTYTIEMQNVLRSVKFICNVSDALLIIDSEVMGSASGTYELSDGNHGIRVKADGYEDYLGNITILETHLVFNIDMQKR